MISNIIILFFISVFISVVLLFLWIHIFYKYWILDNPIKYKKNRAPIPYSIGILFFISFFLISFFALEHTYKLYLIWFFWCIIAWVSFIDDRLNVSPKIRLFIQILIWWIIGLTAIKIWYISNIFWWIIDLDKIVIEIFEYKIYIISLLFTIIWYVFIFNSVNWTDGIEWNTAGLSIINFIIIFLLGLKLYYTDTYDGWIINAEFIIYISVILIWILIPFFFLDISQKALMWDSWTMFLAFMLASLAIISGWKIATVLVVFGIYTVDAFYVIFYRLKRKKSPLLWDYTHLHHRLLDAGLSKKWVLFFTLSFSFLFWLSTLFLDKIGKIFVFIFIIFFVIFAPRIISKYLKNENK